MNKAELKANWGRYCDTDALVNQMMALLSRYGHRNTEHGVCTLLQTYFTNKEPLIKLFMKSKFYAGDMRIVLDEQIARYGDIYQICNCVGKFKKNIHADKAILKFEDANGKKIGDYVKTGVKRMTVSDLITDNAKKTEKKVNWYEVFEGNGSTKESNIEFNRFNYCIEEFKNYSPSTATSRLANNLNRRVPDLKVAQGTKTARVFNRVCHHYKVDELPGYNKLFAEYADLVSELKRDIKFYISLNPLDYLMMSHGRSWHSCHRIGMDQYTGGQATYGWGGWCQGTISYMLDTTSIITFVYDKEPEDIVYEGKLYRNMFHYKDGLLIQSRVYPQGNDGMTDLYAEFRDIVQIALASAMGVKNDWDCPNNVAISYIRSEGGHYRDYSSRSNSNVSSLKGFDTSNIQMTVGHAGICPYCGEPILGHTGCLSHQSCEIPTNH